MRQAAGGRLSLASDKSSRQSSAVSRSGSGRNVSGKGSPNSSVSPSKGKTQHQLQPFDDQTTSVQITTEETISSPKALDATNDDEMEEHIQVLRMSLKQFKTLILDIGELEHTLKSKLESQAPVS